MAVLDNLDTALKEALKARDDLKVSVIRMIKASIKNKEIEKLSPLTDEEKLAVLSTLAKQRRESIEQFSAAGRTDLVAQETKELEFIQSHLPAQLSSSQIDEIIRTAIAECGAASAADLGKLMKVLMPKVKGVADGKYVNQRARELLSPGS